MNHTDRITNRSLGQFHPMNWLEEGDGLLASAKVVRKYWINHKEVFFKGTQDPKNRLRDRTSDWPLVTGLPRSSMLLLGYSVEMYLKAGLVKAYTGCSEEMFERDVKTLFGHKLDLSAKEIAFDFIQGDEANFNSLKQMVLVDTRYPVNVPKGQSQADVVNKQNQRIWSTENFDTYCALAERVREHAYAIDNDKNDPANTGSWNVDKDGFLAFRAGGRLPPRITYRLSSIQRTEGTTSIDDMKSLFPSPEFLRLNRYWDSAQIYEDRVTTKAETFRFPNPSQ